MNTAELISLAWPYVGLGGGIVLLIFLLFTDTCRSDLTKSRWRDPLWLSWMVAFVYLPHVFEEYGLHVLDGQFSLIAQFKEMGMDSRFGEIPTAFFPMINIFLTWIALPIAARLSKKNPVIGLSGMGFILINGMTHLGSCIALKSNPYENFGSITGIFFFLPLFFWILYVAIKGHMLSKKGLTIAIVSGVIAHLLVFALYYINLIAGHVVMLLCVPIVAFSPLIISWLLCKAFMVYPKMST